MLLVGMIGLLGAILVLGAAGAGRWNRLTEALARLQDTTAMIRVRGAAFLLLIFLVLVELLGLEIILGAFTAGAVLGFIDRGWKQTHPLFHARLQAVGFGIFIPVFFVASGIQFNAQALLASGPALLAVPLFLGLLLVVRGLPALLYRRQLGARNCLAAALLQATSLPFLVAGAGIGMELGYLSERTGAALVAAGMFSVLIFPAAALALLRSPGPPRA